MTRLVSWTARPWAREVGIHLVRVATILLAVWVAASWTMEKVSVHPRHSTDGPSPADYGWTYRDVSFRDPAGLTLRGWWIPGTRHQTVVMVHGWTTSRQEPMSKGHYLHDAGYNLLLFDLRGHGASDGRYTTFAWAEPDDVLAAVALARGLDVGPIALLGYSMGAATVIEAGARSADVSAVVEDSGYSSFGDVVRAAFNRSTHLPPDPFVEPVFAIAQADLGIDANRIRPVDAAARLDKPLLVIHGSADELVPVEQGRAIYAAAPGPKELLIVPGAAHVASYFRDPALYKATVLEFLAAAMPGDPATARAG